MKGKFWRKALAAALALLVVSGNVPIKPVADLFGGAAITASAANTQSGKCGTNAKWTLDLDTGELTISGSGDMKNYQTPSDRPWKNYLQDITSVTVESGITSIGDFAFASLEKLSSVNISDTVKSIGKQAFSGCYELTSIKIPTGVTSIAKFAFWYCKKLASVTLPYGITSIGEAAFDDCKSVPDIYCYADPADLSWDMPASSYARNKAVVCHVPAEYYDAYVSKFGQNANVTLQSEAMGRCGDKAYWEFNSETGCLTISGTGAMYDYKYDGDTETVNTPWYSYKDGIISVEIEKGITSIGKSAFYSCASLTSITIPDSVTSIGTNAFHNCTRLESVKIPDSVESIGVGAFVFCKGLTSITIPASVTSIWRDAFYNCTGITDVYCYANPDKLGWIEASCDDFMGEPKSRETVCYVPAEYYDSYVSNFGPESENPVNVTFCPFGECGENATWTLNMKTGKLTISGTGDMWDYEFDYIEKTVTTPWYSYKDDITSVEIENGITSIGNYAFYECTGIPSITIPDSVTSIGFRTFFDCKSLTSITIPDSVTSIGIDAFYNCTGITDVYCYADPANLTWDDGECDDFIRSATGKPTICHVPAEYLDGYNTNFGSTVNVTFKAEAMGKCGDHAYWRFDPDTGKLTISGEGDMDSVGWEDHKGKITSVEIENGITSICNFAFSGCESLSSITISDSVTRIGDSAFDSCTGLTSITIPESVTEIDYDAFYDCTNITDVYCYADPANLTWDERDCDDFIRSATGKPTTICHVREEYLGKYNEKFGSSVNVTFEAEAMGKCGDHAYWRFDPDTGKLTISGTGKMYDYEFEFDSETVTVNSPWYIYKDDITSVEIEKGITSIGASSFDSCTRLASVKIPDSVTSIGGYAFSDCTGLTSITIPDSVTSIKYCAFSGCTGLTSITIPASVTSIGADAFYLCTGIKDVYCDADPANLTWDEAECDDFIYDKDNAPGVHYTTICYVPAKYLDDYNAKFGAESENPVNVTFEAEKMGKCGANATWCFDPDTGKLTISGTGDMADYEYDVDTATINSPWYIYKDDITAVEIEKGITSIGNSSFYKFTSLASIKIPDSVTSIGAQTFDGCTGLTSITIPDSVESIGAAAFAGCKGFTSITIPDSVTSIGRGAFADCTGLTSIVIPAKVTNIDAYAFRSCTGITDVYCYADPANLTWYEADCNDFKEDGTTVCHVPAKYLDTYNSEKFSDVNVRFVGDVDMGLGEHLYGHSITLDGSIGVNFYVELTDELLASETAEMIFTVPNGSKTDTQTLLVKDVIADESNKVSIGSKTYYKFRCSISAKDMASEITAQLVDGESKGKEYTYSVKDYAEYLLAHPEVEEYANAAPLVKAMLNYGAASQTYFSIEGTAANAALTDEEKALDNVTIPAKFEYDGNAALPEGVTFEGATLSLKSETTLSLYFKGLADSTEFTCDGKTVETAKNGKYVVARIRGIKANELEKDFTVTFADNSVKYNVMTYCYNVLNDGTVGENLQNVCKALYRYAEAANAYFGEGERDDQDTDW